MRALGLVLLGEQWRVDGAVERGDDIRAEVSEMWAETEYCWALKKRIRSFSLLPQ